MDSKPPEFDDHYPVLATDYYTTSSRLDIDSDVTEGSSYIFEDDIGSHRL